MISIPIDHFNLENRVEVKWVYDDDKMSAVVLESTEIC